MNNGPQHQLGPDHPRRQLWDEFRKECEDRGLSFSPVAISQWINESKGFAPSTIRDWIIDLKRLPPRSKYWRICSYLDSNPNFRPKNGLGEANRIKWTQLYDLAQAHEERRPQEQPPDGPPAEGAPSSDASLGHPLDAQPSANEPLPPPSTIEAPLPARVRVWRQASLLATGGIAFLVVAAAIILLRPANKGTSSSPPATAASTAASPQPGRSSDLWLCTRVRKVPAPVFPVPDENVRELKHKFLGQEIEVFQGVSTPPGWVLIHTPKLAGGRSWMRWDDLDPSLHRCL